MPCEFCTKQEWDDKTCHVHYDDSAAPEPLPWHHYIPAIKPGDMVMFPRLAGVDFTLGSGDGPKEEGGFMILEARDIMCTFVDNTALGLEVVEIAEEER